MDEFTEEDEKECMARAKAYVEGTMHFQDLHPFDIKYIRRYGKYTKQLDNANLYLFGIILADASMEYIKNTTIREAYESYLEKKKNKENEGHTK